MSAKKFSKMIFLPILALNLVPLVATGDDQAPKPKKPVEVDLQVAELNNAINNFKPAIKGRDPGNVAYLYGSVFADCLKSKDHGGLSFASTQSDSSLKDSGVVGFRITDTGTAGRDCMTKHKQNNEICSEDSPCVSISGLPGGSIDLGAHGDVSIKLFHRDPNRDVNADKSDLWQDFDSPLKHVGAATIRAQREAEEKRRKEALVRTLQQQVRTCRKSAEDRETALTAGEMLRDMGLKSDDDLERLKKELASFELKELGSKFMKTPLKDDEATAELVEQLKAFEADHPESADGIAVLMYQKALAYAKGAKSDEQYDKASAMIAEAQGLDGLNDVAATRLENYQRDIQVGKFQLEARSPDTDPMAFWQNYQSFMWDLQTGLRTCSGQQMSGESCKSMMGAYKASSQIPQQAQQAAYEQYVFQMKMQQQMMQFSGMGGAFGGGMAMNGSASGSGFYK